MVARIDVRYAIPDARGEARRRAFENLGLTGKIRSVTVVDSYLIDARLKQDELVRAAEALTNPLVEEYALYPFSIFPGRRPVIGRGGIEESSTSSGNNRTSLGANRLFGPDKFDWAVEIGFLPGVADNVGTTAREVIEDALRRKFTRRERIYSSRVFFISGRLREADVRRIVDSLHNPLIERATVKSRSRFMRDGGMGIAPPRVRLRRRQLVARVNLDVDDRELARIGRDGIKNLDGTRRGPLTLDLASMKAIRDYFRTHGRRPTDVELESIAQTWSEHCKHTIFSSPIDEIEEGLYRRYIQGATAEVRKKKGKKDFCVSVFKDNSGAIIFDRKHLVTHKVETHNTPSALDPLGGALTGILGVNRDCIGFGLGAKPVANIYGFCVADPKDTRPFYRDKKRTQLMLPPKRILEGVVQGVNVGGNCSGIPTPTGFVNFNECFRGKPLVFVGTVGLIPRIVCGKLAHIKRARPGDYIVMAGGRVGLDGIHGATFSSESLHSESPATAVQIGDPITQKKLSDALVKEARDRGLYRSITDNGAGGLSCSVSEMARESDGCLVLLDKVPLKYPGLAPWQIWVSESQERMTLAVPPAKWRELRDLLEKRGVEATVIGKFTSSGRCMVMYRGRTVMDVELEFLHEGLPKRHLRTQMPIDKQQREDVWKPALRKAKDLTEVTRAMLGRLNIASYEFISRQFDHEVQAGSVVKPLQGRGRINSDASVIRPLLSSKRGVVLSYGISLIYPAADPYRMASCAIDTAVRAAIAAGGTLDHLALLDNFCWTDARNPERLYELKQAAKACYDYATSYGTPFISGKDSMFNDWTGYDAKGRPVRISAHPTLLISGIGVVSDIERAVSIDAKAPGDLVYLLGETHNELGCSEYYSMLAEKQERPHAGTLVPSVDAKKNKKLYRALERAIRNGLVASAISVSRGGLATALMKTAMASMLGLEISLHYLPGSATSDDSALFSESQGRIVATAASRNRARFERIMRGNTVSFIGRVVDSPIVCVRGLNGKPIVHLPLKAALTAYRGTFKGF